MCLSQDSSLCLHRSLKTAAVKNIPYHPEAFWKKQNNSLSHPPPDCLLRRLYLSVIEVAASFGPEPFMEWRLFMDMATQECWGLISVTLACKVLVPCQERQAKRTPGAPQWQTFSLIKL
jgi:hypothetical protein